MKNYFLILFVSFQILFFISNEIECKCKKSAGVKYLAKYGWSKIYYVDVFFFSGYELNQATKTFNYSTFSIYAIIFWDNDEATIIKLDSLLICGLEVTSDCIDNNILDLQGSDQDGDKWNICLSGYCF